MVFGGVVVEFEYVRVSINYSLEILWLIICLFIQNIESIIEVVKVVCEIGLIDVSEIIIGLFLYYLMCNLVNIYFCLGKGLV